MLISTESPLHAQESTGHKMNPNCVLAVETAALNLGRKIKAAEMRDMEVRVRGTLKQMAVQDSAAYRNMSMDQRLNKAGDLIAEQLKHEAAVKAKRAELQMKAINNLQARITNTMQRGNTTFAGALKRTMGTFFDNKGYGESIEQRAQARAFNYVRDLMEAIDLDRQGTLFGLLSNKEGIDAIVKEAYGKDSGNPQAKRAWKEIEALQKRIIQDFNDKGGDIAMLKDYRLPQKLDMFRVYNAGQKAFVDRAMKNIDRSKYFDKDGNPLDDAGMRKFLEEAFITYATDGFNKGTRGEYSSSVANRHKAHRQIFWKDDAAYMDMMNNYGGGSLLDQIIGHVHSLSNEMTLMETFGPNALHTVNMLSEQAKKVDGTLNKDAMSDLSRFEDMVDIFSGAKGGVEFSKVGVHKFFRAFKDLNVASLLGSILTSQLADNGTAIATVRAMNMSMAQWGIHKTAFYGSKQMKDFARSQGLAFRLMNNMMMRYGDDMANSSWHGKLATGLMRVSGSNFFTNMHREALATFTIDQVGGLARKYDWDAVPAADKALMEANGFTKQTWDILRAAEPDTSGGPIVSAKGIEGISNEKIAELIGTKNKKAIANAREDAVLKLNGYALTVAQHGVVQPTLEIRSQMDYNKGNIMGEIGSAVAQFKTFPWALFRQHLVNMSRGQGGMVAANKYRLGLVAMTSVLGGLGLLMGDIAAGRDPREVYNEDDPFSSLGKFALQSVVKGGGMSFLADLLAVDWEGRDPVEQMTGPTASKLATLGKLGQSVFTGGDDIGRRTIDAAKTFTPFQNLLWTRAVLHNGLISELNEMAQPGYMKRIQNLAEKNYGSEYFFGYGAETRAPEFGNIVAQ